MLYYKLYKTEIWLLTLPLLILLILRLLGFDGMLGQDSYEYVRYTEKIKEFYLTGVHPGIFFWSKGYPLLAGVFSIIIPTNIATQLVSVISLLSTFIFAKKIISIVYKKAKNSNYYLLLGLLLSPYLLRASLVSMSDMLAICFLVASFYFYLSYKRKQLFKFIFFTVFCGLYSVFTRYAAIIPVAILFLAITLFWFKHIKWKHLFVLIIPLIFISIYFFFEVGTTDFIKHEWISHWNILNAFKNSFVIDGTSHNPLPNLLYGLYPFFHPGFFILGGILVLYSLKRIKLFENINSLLLALLVVFYTVFMIGVPFQNNRFLLLIFPFVLILLYPAYNDLINKFIRFKTIIIGLLIITQLVFFIRAIQPSYQQNVIEKSISAELVSFQNETLYCFEIDVAIKGRGLTFNYKNLWIEEYKFFEKGALVLFNEEKLKDQWKGKNPMINWENLKTNYKLVLINKLDAGWNLYRIE